MTSASINASWKRVPDWIRDGLVAGLIAAIFSGLPSTIYAVAIGGNILEATLAAGSILVGADASNAMMIISAIPVHLAVSVWWAVILARTIPARGTLLWSSAAAVVIAVFDLLLVGSFFPMIAALDFTPQLADHLAFGAITGTVLQRRRAMRSAGNACDFDSAVQGNGTAFKRNP